MSIRYAARRDAAEPAIVAALRAAGASVEIISNGDGLPDLMVGYRGVTYHLEVKNPTGPRGGKSGGGASRPGQGGDGVLTRDQRAWWAAWRGAPPVIVRTPAEALAAIGAPPPAATAPPVECAPPAPPIFGAGAATGRPRVRAKPEACRDRTAHAVPPDRDTCACGDPSADFGAKVELRCSACPLEYVGKMGYADGLWAPFHWLDGGPPKPMCPGAGRNGVPVSRDAKPVTTPARAPRRRATSTAPGGATP